MSSDVSVAPYAGFEHIDTIDELGPDDEACIAELRSVLARHNRLDRLGICLLHQHFALAEDEILLESCDEANRSFYLRPVKRSTLREEEAIYTSWTLRDDVSPVPLQACKKKDHWILRDDVSPVPLQACKKKDH